MMAAEEAWEKQQGHSRSKISWQPESKNSTESMRAIRRIHFLSAVTIMINI